MRVVAATAEKESLGNRIGRAGQKELFCLECVPPLDGVVLVREAWA